LKLAKVKITGLDKLPAKIKREVATAIKRSNFENELTVAVKEQIRVEGVGDLAPNTIRNREYLARFNSTHKDYISWFSNLTFTGQLIESLKVKFIVGKLTLNIISSDRKHKKYKGKNGTHKSSPPSLNDIFEFQKKNGKDIAEPLKTQSFVDLISTKLKQAIKQFYRN